MRRALGEAAISPRLRPASVLACAGVIVLMLGACGKVAVKPIASAIVVHPSGTSADVDAIIPAARHSTCRVPGAAARARRALQAARGRYRLEASGSVIQADLARIAGDRVLIGALSARRLGRALVAAERALVRHVVRIRVVEDRRVMVDANPTSFDVAGLSRALRGRHGRPLGRLEITVQDVIGFIKLAIRRGGADAVLVRGSGGAIRTSLPELATRVLPARGCVLVGATAYVARSFTVRGFTDSTLKVWVLVAA